MAAVKCLFVEPCCPTHTLFLNVCIVTSHYLNKNNKNNIQGGPIKTVHFSDTIFLQPLQI